MSVKSAARIQFSGSEGSTEAMMTLIENLIGNFNEQQ